MNTCVWSRDNNKHDTYIINVNTIYLEDQGVPEYLHKHVDKYRKQTSEVIIDKLQKDNSQPSLDVGGFLRWKSESFTQLKNIPSPMHLGLIMMQACEGMRVYKSLKMINQALNLWEWGMRIYSKDKEVGSSWKEEEGPLSKGWSPMDEIKAPKWESSTFSSLFNNQIVALELLEVESSPPFDEALPKRG